MERLPEFLGPGTPFPDPECALEEPNGLLAIGADLQPDRLLDAYRRGIFPWYSEGDPLLWWSPDPRMLLFPKEFHASRSLKKTIRNKPLTVTVNRAFADVVDGCAAPRSGDSGTWILPEMQQAYGRLHESGHAHSVEVWSGDQLVGGLYGISLGRLFFGESMFSRVSDASKVALAALVALARQHDFSFIDCQMENPHLTRLGARPVARRDFLAELKQGLDWQPPINLWSRQTLSATFLLQYF